MSKIKTKLKSLNDAKLSDIPWRIASKCILSAKTDRAKEKLVRCAIYATSEDYAREITHSIDTNNKQHSLSDVILNKIKSLMNNFVGL